MRRASQHFDTVESLDPVRLGLGKGLRITMYAWAKMLVWSRLGDTEVTGFCITSSEDPMLIDDVFLVKAECSVASVEIDDEALADFEAEMVDDYELSSWQCRRIWWHTHPTNNVSPSNVDETTFDEHFMHAPYGIMLITSKHGNASARLRIKQAEIRGEDDKIRRKPVWIDVPLNVIIEKESGFDFEDVESLTKDGWKDSYNVGLDALPPEFLAQMPFEDMFKDYKECVVEKKQVQQSYYNGSWHAGQTNANDLKKRAERKTPDMWWWVSSPNQRVTFTDKGEPRKTTFSQQGEAQQHTFISRVEAAHYVARHPWLYIDKDIEAEAAKLVGIDYQTKLDENKVFCSEFKWDRTRDDWMAVKLWDHNARNWGNNGLQFDWNIIKRRYQLDNDAIAKLRYLDMRVVLAAIDLMEGEIDAMLTDFTIAGGTLALPDAEDTDDGAKGNADETEEVAVEPAD